MKTLLLSANQQTTRDHQKPVFFLFLVSLNSYHQQTHRYDTTRIFFLAAVVAAIGTFTTTAYSEDYAGHIRLRSSNNILMSSCS